GWSRRAYGERSWHPLVCVVLYLSSHLAAVYRRESFPVILVAMGKPVQFRNPCLTLPLLTKPAVCVSLTTRLKKQNWRFSHSERMRFKSVKEIGFRFGARSRASITSKGN